MTADGVTLVMHVGRALVFVLLWLLLIYWVAVGVDAAASMAQRLGATRRSSRRLAYAAAICGLIVALAGAGSVGRGSAWTSWLAATVTMAFVCGVGFAMATRARGVARTRLDVVDIPSTPAR